MNLQAETSEYDNEGHKLRFCIRINNRTKNKIPVDAIFEGHI